MKKNPWGACLIALVCVLIALGACAETSAVGPTGAGTSPAPCGLRCAPPVRLPANEKTVQTSDFTLIYPNEWSIENQDSTSVVLKQQLTAGIFEVEVASTSVPNGTSASQLLTSVMGNFDTSQLTGVQDDGPIYGAEVGYTAGAGDVIEGTLAQPNAPSAPVFVEFMTSTRGTTGLAFIALSTINPAAKNPARILEAINGEFDQLANGVEW